MKLSQRIQNVQPSMTLAVDAKAKALRAQGIDVIGFGAGEPDFFTADNIKEAAVRAIQDNQTLYTPVGGTEALKDAIIQKFETDNDLTYERNQIVASCGAKHTFYNLAQALWEEGDEILVPGPYWVSYPDMVKLAGATPVIVPTTAASNFKTSPDQLKRLTTIRTRALIINSPSNPTGSAYDKKELEALASFALENGLLLISDEIYEKIVFEGFEQMSIASLADEVKHQTVIINGVSKAYCMTGWRIGYLAAQPEIAAAVQKLQSQSTSNPASISQAAAVEALRGPQDYIQKQVKKFQERRNHLVTQLNTMDGVTCNYPAGTFYSFPDFSGTFARSHKGKPIQGSLGVAEFLLEEAKVALVPGIAFGADDHMRLSFACSMEILSQGLDRIGKALSSLT